MKPHYLALALLVLVGCKNQEADQAEPAMEESTETTNSTTDKGYPTEVYFGDTHLHTELSMDAGAFGNRLSVDDAYRFAKGEEVTSSSGVTAKLSKPLDFLVVADHSDGMGLFQALMNNEEWVMEFEQGRKWADLIDEGKGAEAAVDLIKNFSQGTMEMNPNTPELMESVWKITIDGAEKHNQPGKFTAFIGYEWTSLIAGNNLHRVVIYRDNGEKTIGHLPYIADVGGSPDPEKLWENLQSYEDKTGGQVLAIPHNGNLSNGIMFARTTVDGDPFDLDYVQRRQRWEPIYEITQIKGDGEAHPFLSPNDEFADFENWDFGNLDLSAVKTNEMLEGEYARSALKMGLQFKGSLGVNPYKMGFIGSTDAHTSLATADDPNFFGKAANVEPYKERWEHPFIESELASIITWQTVASGYAAVWAQENTRESLFDAMMRRETYGTTGSRMKIRFFGGWDFTDADLEGDWVANGYERGVPMGGDLKNGVDKTPSFIVHTLMDPDYGSLDRIQIVKGWLNADGTTGEKVYDVVWSGDRQMDANGKVPLVANTVNVKDATWDNSSGAPELSTVWTDPDFDPSQEAFYYVRVLEIPTPRWTLYDKVNLGAEMPDNVPMTMTQRGYTSPIWYSPM
ncbi:DUF3604 domain-containing protein [Aureitalea marina]|uniref:DUF3604 domain-containing protein n=1 Tax=Aureitalea marina TaxID=930804 RepID=A0A2S7KS52_9FLAO|nr:DUF3604 domain-containing protein [Aureitalea marina]PQB05383.1 hypothetical protein BST85_11155 [Aureitalea marina]